MIGKNGIVGFMALALMGSFVGLSMLGVDMASAFADSIGVTFLVGVIATVWGCNSGVADIQGVLKDAPFPNVVYGTAASEVMNLRNQEQSQELHRRLEQNGRNTRGQ
jgi:hypothetical protein